MPFALGLGQTSDNVDWVGALFRSFGAELVDAKGNITVKSDAVKQALEYMAKLAKFLPEDAVSYDDASNNRALISGKSALIFNPPSAWAVAKRDAPAVAADCWTFPAPAGPKGRFVPYLPYFWGIWTFSKNKTAAKDLLDLPDAAGAGGGARATPWSATTSRLSSACPTSRSGRRSSRRAARCTTIRSGRSTMRRPRSPLCRRRRRSPCRSTTVAPCRRWWQR